MKSITIRLVSLGLLVAFCVALLSLSVFADSGSALLSVTTTTSNNSSANPDESTFGSQSTSSVSPFTVVSSGAHNRINRFNFRVDGVTSTHFFVRVDFTVVAVKSQGTQSVTIDDLFPVSISGYNTNHTVPVTVSDSNYSVRCYQYMLGEYLGDFGDIWISGVSEQYVVRGNKTISFLLEVTAPAVNTGSNLTITLNTPVTLYHTTNRADTLHLIPTQVSSYFDYSQVLFSYLVDIRNDLDQAEFNSAGIWQLLVNHEGDIDNLEKLTDILALLSNMRSDLMAVRQSLLQLFTPNSSIPMFMWTYFDISQDSNGEYIASEVQSNWYMAVLRSIQNITLDITKSLKYQNQIDQGSTNETGSALESFLDQLNQQNAYGLISSFDVSQISGDTDISALGTVLIDGLPVWWTQGVKDLIDAVPQTRIVDGEEWVLPYNDAKAELDEVLGLGGGD